MKSCLAILVLCSASLAQQVASHASVQTSADLALQKYRDSKAATLRDDFGELARYREANADLRPPAEGEDRIVFFGDSITDMWKLDEFFPGRPYVNRGIGGQTTPQMLIRFRQDVVQLQPRAVVILAGTNDIAGNTGPMRTEDIEANFASMAEIAEVLRHRSQDSTAVYAKVAFEDLRGVARAWPTTGGV